MAPLIPFVYHHWSELQPQFGWPKERKFIPISIQQQDKVPTASQSGGKKKSAVAKGTEDLLPPIVNGSSSSVRTIVEPQYTDHFGTRGCSVYWKVRYWKFYEWYSFTSLWRSCRCNWFMHDRYKLFTYTTHTPTMFFTLASYYNSTKVKVKGQFSADYAVCLTSAP